MPEVSIVIPTYNREVELTRAMYSVKSQTFQDWEMIVVDDCSTDGTSVFVQSWSLTDKRVKYYKTYKNTGSPVIPRNIGTKWASAPWIAYLDSDDYWHPQKLEWLLEEMKDRKVVLGFHNMKVAYASGRLEKWSQMSTCFSGKIFDELLRKNFIPTSSVIVDKKTVIKHGMMDVSLDVSHDWDLWLKIAFENEIYYLDKQLGTLSIDDVNLGSVISDAHRRRRESRKVIKRWISYCDGMYYRKVMLYYYLMEVFDVLPMWMKTRIRSWWYKQEKYK